MKKTRELILESIRRKREEAANYEQGAKEWEEKNAKYYKAAYNVALVSADPKLPA